MSSVPQPLRNFSSSVETFAQKPHSAFALFVIAVCESCLLPIPLDFFFMPLALARPKRAVFYAVICVVGSTVGAIIGYHIGYLLFESVGSRLVEYFGWTELFQRVLLQYHTYAWVALLFAGFTPIPFEVFTFAAGFEKTIPLATFVVAVLAGRSLRFVPVGVAMYLFGSDVKVFLRKYFRWIAIAVPILLLLWFVATRYLF